MEGPFELFQTSLPVILSRTLIFENYEFTKFSKKSRFPEQKINSVIYGLAPKNNGTICVVNLKLNCHYLLFFFVLGVLTKFIKSWDSTSRPETFIWVLIKKISNEKCFSGIKVFNLNFKKDFNVFKNKLATLLFNQ